MVPDGWKRAPVSDYGNVSAGRQRSPNFTEGTIRPYLRVANVFEARIDSSDVNEMPFTDREYERYKLEYGDILLNEGQSTELVGRPAMYEGDPANCCFQNTLVRFKAHKNVDANFALQRFLLCLHDGTFQAISKKTTSIAHLGVSRFAELQLNWPPLPEQKKIAQILSTWDKAIITTEQLLANSQQQKKALMQQLLTGKKRLLDKNGVRFSGEWKSYHLSHVAVIVMGSSPKSEAYNENGIGLPLLQGNADIKNRISAPRVFTSEITKECEIGDILLSVRAPVGTVAISEHKACIGRGIAALHAKPNFDQSFIYQFLLWFEPKWGSLSQGSTFESINSDDIKNLKIKVPNFGEQQKIAAILSTADQEISALQQKLDALKQEKKALMQQLLTGKRRVQIN